MKDPFNPKTGEFRENIRSITGISDAELRASMQTFGWLKHLPAYADQNGVIIVGHRRLKIAAELGITSVIVKFDFDSPTDALALAIASNVGSAAMDKKARQRIAVAACLAGHTQQEIAKVLGVSQNTISRDLESLSTVDKLPPRTSKRGRKGEGRPKGSGKKGDAEKLAAKQEREAARRKADREAREAKAAEEAEIAKRDAKIIALHKKGLNASQISPEVGGLHERRVARIIQDHALVEKGKTEREVTRDDLSPSAQEKFDSAIRQYKKQLDAKFEQSVLDGIKDRIDDMVLPHYQKKMAEAQQALDRRKGVMDRATFDKIRRCLHPDSRNSASDARLNEAFRLFSSLEVRLMDEKEHPTAPSSFKMPSTYQELMEARRKVQEARRAKRAAGNSQSPARR